MDFTYISQHPVQMFILATNIITMVVSIGLAVIGILGFFNISLVLLGSNSLPWILIILSLLIIFASAVGCTPNLMENKRLMSTYGIMVSLLVIFQFIVVMYALAQHGKADSILDQAWQHSYDHNPRNLKNIEKKLFCCGFSSVEDRAVPKTCRKSSVFGYQFPCQDQLSESYAQYEKAMLVCVISIQILQVLALALSGVRWLQTHRDEETEAQYRAEHAATIFRGLREEDQILQQSASSSDGVPGYGSTNN